MVDQTDDGVNSYLLADEEEQQYGKFSNISQEERRMRTELGINYVSSDLAYDVEGQDLES
jgi:hypothetical protein